MLEQIPALPEGYEFHHIGYATASLQKEIDFFALLGYSKEGEIFVDKAQGVKGCFVCGPGPRIELLEDISGSLTLTPWLKAGVKMYHLAYFVNDLDVALSWARNQRAKVTVAPVAAVAFGRKRICFVMFRNGLMLEFIEKSSLFRGAK
jgi:methylmalonyl-CoA/ethylmalonyl-CoA epimerase